MKPRSQRKLALKRKLRRWRCGGQRGNGIAQCRVINPRVVDAARDGICLHELGWKGSQNLAQLFDGSIVREPLAFVLRAQDNRHSIVNRCDEHIGGACEYAECSQGFADRVTPCFPDASECERRLIYERDAVRHLSVSGLLPFVKPVSRNKAATVTEGGSKGRLCRSGFTPRIDQACADLLILCPRGNESPLCYRERVGSFVENDGKVLCRCDVESTHHAFRSLNTKTLGDSLGMGDSVAATHRPAMEAVSGKESKE